jgi:hypothetical protein
MSVAAYRTFARAQAELSALIVNKYGSEPAILDDLKVSSVPIRIAGSEHQALALYAHPLTCIHTIDDICMVIFAKPDVMPLIVTEGSVSGQ